ncbi:hypothetical protein Vadar_006997 [Vaccinium darrowii]|uniref:Uncharacterized protein n=1 Tax=Vaccinium darrowii TaxID=229202 RepID=A0ACB7ZI08_9ERIC|nr:hypothetical protein Vadar_006997 [Vaccinium darrowii]
MEGPTWSYLFSPTAVHVRRMSAFGQHPTPLNPLTPFSANASAAIKHKALIALAITSSKVGGSTFERIEDAIDYVSNRLSFDDSCLLAMRHTAADAFRGSSSSHDLLTSCCPSNSLHSTGPDLKNVLDRNEAQIPSELINHWVATFLMIQKCTKREFPPADVVVILDSAVASLQPCCSQNLPVSAEIQKCMGIIKNQILALVPT